MSKKQNLTHPKAAKLATLIVVGNRLPGNEPSDDELYGFNVCLIYTDKMIAWGGGRGPRTTANITYMPTVNG